ncbi:MAG TPA: putative glycolipid-binding domain-containing protein [Thermomicrobiales bacterium]|nr:putative glycolipid-binding domain-containing protein [Thermomicrobiales bacterium]
MAKRLKHPVGRTVMWRIPNEPGSEIAEVTGTPGDGWRLRGHVHLVEEDAPVRVSYLVLCDDHWTTRYADVEFYRGPGESRFVQLLRDPDLGWQRREATSRDAAPALEFETLAGLDDAIDVDLEFSPITNTLPIRRLAPRTGNSVDLTAAWVRFPALTVEPSRQTYTRLAAKRYRFASATGYVAEIEVDDLGLVVDYGDVWERVAVTDAPWSRPNG